MNNKGFTLIELLACLALLGVILGIGLYVTRDTLSTSLSTLIDVSEKQIYDAAYSYVLENDVIWTNVNGEEYTCLTPKNLVDDGYFDNDEVTIYKNNMIKVVRESKTKDINKIKLVDECNN